jgi:predicted NBD/HSP70 family sugar kinase
MAEYSIGLDLGGTNLRAAAVNRAGKILEKISVSANPMLGRESLLGGMVAVINDLRSRWGTDQLAGIGLGIPGFILLKEGVIRNSNNLAALEDFPFRDEMERRLNTKVVLENDANAAAYAEFAQGTGEHTIHIRARSLRGFGRNECGVQGQISGQRNVRGAARTMIGNEELTGHGSINRGGDGRAPQAAN